MNIIYAIESRLWIVFTICYSYQIFYMVYMLLFKRSLSERFINRDPVMHKIAVVISARQRVGGDRPAYREHPRADLSG